MQKDYPRLIPTWLLVLVIIIVVALCSSCKTGGRYLGSGSAGTVIRPQTPQQINEASKRANEQRPRESYKLPKGNPIPKEKNKVIIKNLPDPKETIAKSIKPVKAKNKPETLPPAKTSNLIAGDGGCVIITDDRGGRPEIAGPCEVAPEKKGIKIHWTKLIIYYLLAAMILTVSWMCMNRTPKKKTKSARRET